MGIEPSGCCSGEEFMKRLKQFDIQILDAIFYGKVIYDDGFWATVIREYKAIIKQYKLEKLPLRDLLTSSVAIIILEDVEMLTPKSVALISAGYPPIMAGGIDVQTYDLAHALSSLNVNVTVLCGGSKTPKRIQETPNLTVLRLPMANVPPRVVGFQLQNLGTFRKILPNYDIIHSQHSSGSIYGLLKQNIKKPWVVSFHDHQLTRLKVLFEVKPWRLSVGDLAYYTAGYSIFEVLTRL